MKKPLSLFLLLALLASCKKNYTCSCTTVLIGKSSNGSYITNTQPGTDKEYSQKLTKKQAESACSYEQNAIQTSFNRAYTDNGYAPLKSGESINTTCNLK